jgi:hypothetical protein
MIPIALLPQVFYSGSIVPISDMNTVNQGISMFAISRWTVTGFMENYVGHVMSSVWRLSVFNLYLAVFFLGLTALVLYGRGKERID